jgi:predicted transcriptional regulator
MEQIKEAFQRVREDISYLTQEMRDLKLELNETKQDVLIMSEILNNLVEKKQIAHTTDNNENKTTSTHLSTHNLALEGLKPQYLDISNGNGGVPTDKQTNRQTDNPTLFTQENSFSSALEALESLDTLKKEIRLKFKRLTEQELIVFSTLYQINEEKGPTDYRTLSLKLKLSESSIRDYIGRLIKKGIPVEKNKLNNKNIQLYVSNDLKKIASLNTILELRNL